MFGDHCKRYEHEAGFILHLEGMGKSAVFTTPRACNAYSASSGSSNAGWVPCMLVTKTNKELFKVTRNDIIITEHDGKQKPKLVQSEGRKLAHMFHQNTPIPQSTHAASLMANQLMCIVAGTNPVYVVIETYGDAQSEKWTEILFIPDKQQISEKDFTAGRSNYVNIREQFGRAGKRRPQQNTIGRMGNNSRRGK
jgi:hypothetical protein